MADSYEVGNTQPRRHEVSFSRGLSRRALRLLRHFGTEHKDYWVNPGYGAYHDAIITATHSREYDLGTGEMARVHITRASLQFCVTSPVAEILARLTPTGIGPVGKVQLDCSAEAGPVRSISLTRAQYDGVFPVAYQNDTLTNLTYQDKKDSFVAMLEEIEAKVAGR